MAARRTMLGETLVPGWAMRPNTVAMSFAAMSKLIPRQLAH